MEYTPGPWQVGHNLIDPNLHLSVHEAEAGWCIANCDMTVRPTEENEANARLIAAAPDLLDALQKIQVVIGARGCTNKGIYVSMPGEYCGMIDKIAGAAITRAVTTDKDSCG